MTAQTALRASFVDHALGVHTDLVQGNFSDIETLIAQARYAGIDTLRVGVPVGDAGADPWFAPFVDRIAEAGLRVQMLVDTAHSPEANARAVAVFAARHPGALAFVEGPNEPSNWGVSYAGQDGMEGARLWQNAFHDAMEANPATRGILLAGPSSYLATRGDLVTIHPYAHDGDQPGFWLRNDLAGMRAADPGKGFVITETGYDTRPGAGSHAVDDLTQAKFTLNTYLDGVSLGARHVGLFALRDWANPDWDHYGLFRADNSPKPAATALHNLQAILRDDHPDAATFAPAALDFGASLPPDVQSLLLQKASGDFLLALWREPDIWDQETRTPIAASASSFTLRIGAAAEFTVYDPLLGSAAIRRETSGAGLALTVTDHPILVSFRPDAPGTGTPPPVRQVPVFDTIGSGPDALAIRVSGDAYQGFARYVVTVDGVAIGGEREAFASHGAGEADTLTLRGDWGGGLHRIAIAFTNDLWGGTPDTDRNLYVEGIAINGWEMPGTARAMDRPGVSEFLVVGPADGGRLHVGGTGHDVIDLSSTARRAGSFLHEANGDVTFRSHDGADTYRSIEVIEFADGRMVFDEKDPAAQVVRLYQAGLGRGADQDGLNHWIRAIEEGAPLSRLAEGFLASPEFAARYGGGLSTAEFVERLYVNALGRASDPGGKADWIRWIDGGTVTRAEALVGFSESAENRAHTAGLVGAGIWDVSEDAAFLARLYDTAFGRLPDLSGLGRWREGLEAGRLTVHDVVNGFVGSAEFAGRYGNGVSTGDFVELLYVNALDRAPDPGGKADWVRWVDGGTISRADAVLGFSESAEHKALTAHAIMNENPDHFGILFAGW